MSFYEQSPAVRLNTPNQAEITFDATFPDSAPWGIDHPPLDVSTLPPIVRYAPDRLMSGKFVECKGIGKDNTLKVKIEQLEALRFWDHIMPVQVFIWNSYHKRWTMVTLRDLVHRFHLNGTLKQFPDNNKPAWFMNVSFLEAEWTDAA